MSYTQLLSTILKSSFKAIIALLFVGSLAMNIITMTWTTEGIAAKGALAAVASITSVAADLGSKLAASEKVAIGLRGDLDANEKVVTDLRGNLAASEEVATDLRGNLAASEKLVTDFRNTLAANEVTITDLGIELAAKQTVITGLENRRNANKKAVSQITKRITRRTIVGAVRNIAAAPAELVPWAGVAVIFGVTALEIKDACATIEDMDEIRRSMDINDAAEENTVCGKELPSKEDIVKVAKNSPNEALDSLRELGVDIPEDIREDTPEDAHEDEREDTGKGGNFFRNSWESARKYFSDD